VLATLENVTVEVAGMAPETVALGIDEEGLVIGRYGKLAWAGSKVSVEGEWIDLCILHVETSTGARATFTVPAASLGRGLSAPVFAKSIQRAAAHFGATVVSAPARV
jgi:hypothetical protein